MGGTRTVHIRIFGRVQGVGFRAWVQTTARQLGLGGWVRNRRDGSVETVIHGTSDQVSTMLHRCEQGPPAARVASVELLGEVGGTYQSFEFYPTS